MLENLSNTEQEILNVIKTVIDPEVEINIVDLGLIYNITHKETEKTIHVLATLSARGCPVGDTILNHIKVVVESNWSGYEVEVELTWEPQWTPEMITPEGKAVLNM